MAISKSVDINFGKRFVVFMETIFFQWEKISGQLKSILLPCKTSSYLLLWVVIGTSSTVWLKWVMNKYQRNISHAINPSHTLTFETLNLFIAPLRLSLQILTDTMITLINMQYFNQYFYIRLGTVLCYLIVIFTSPLGNTVSKILRASRKSYIHFAFSFTDIYHWH